MPRKCPPGVFCIDNITLLILICIAMAVIYIIYNQTKNLSSSETNKLVVVERNNNPYFTNPNYQMSRNRGQIYLNPYSPPLKRNPFFPPNSQDVRGVPINISTSHYDF